MNELLLLKVAGLILSVCCIIFGWKTAKKGLRVMRHKDSDEILKNAAAEHFGAEAAGIGMFVFAFGFGLIYLLFRL